jgi:hypothetical protein
MAMTEWQPIDTAPDDGRDVDLWAGDRRYADCHFHLCQWLYWSYESIDQEPSWREVKNPSHWMPIPDPPGAA